MQSSNKDTRQLSGAGIHTFAISFVRGIEDIFSLTAWAALWNSGDPLDMAMGVMGKALCG